MDSARQIINYKLLRQNYAHKIYAKSAEKTSVCIKRNIVLLSYSTATHCVIFSCSHAGAPIERYDSTSTNNIKKVKLQRKQALQTTCTEI